MSAQSTASRVARSAKVGSWRRVSGVLQRLGMRDCKSVQTDDATDAIYRTSRDYRPAQSMLSLPSTRSPGPHQKQLSAAPQVKPGTRRSLWLALAFELH